MIMANHRPIKVYTKTIGVQKGALQNIPPWQSAYQRLLIKFGGRAVSEWDFFSKNCQTRIFPPKFADI